MNGSLTLIGDIIMKTETKRTIGSYLSDAGYALSRMGAGTAITSGICAGGSAIAGDRKGVRYSLIITGTALATSVVGRILIAAGSKIVNSSYEE